MTQLIAALCDGGKGAVAISDRMVSTADMTLGFESPNHKAEVITPKCAVLLAGTIHEPDLLRDARERARGKERFRDVAEVIKTVYQEVRTRRVVDDVLKVRTGINDFAEYHQKQRTLHDSVVIDANDAIARYNLGLELILVGMDDQAHLAIVSNPGQWRSFDNLGWCVVGMGDRHAESVFAWYNYSSNVPLNEALYIAFEAKKKAEMAGGVGPTTDALIVTANGIEAVKEETIRTLEEVYDERERGGERKRFPERIANLKPVTEKLEIA